MCVDKTHPETKSEIDEIRKDEDESVEEASVELKQEGYETIPKDEILPEDGTRPEEIVKKLKRRKKTPIEKVKAPSLTYFIGKFSYYTNLKM